MRPRAFSFGINCDLNCLFHPPHQLVLSAHVLAIAALAFCGLALAAIISFPDLQPTAAHIAATGSTILVSWDDVVGRLSASVFDALGIMPHSFIVCLC